MTDLFLKELTELINRHNAEAGSNTPAEILADYLVNCLRCFDRATTLRTKFFKNPTQQPATDYWKQT
jgi:hypothetical protein